MADVKFPYPPCTPGPLSEKPRRHEFQINRDPEGRAFVRIHPKSGAFLYHVSCKHCGLNDPNPPRF